MSLLSAENRERISHTIKETEKESHAEIVVSAVPSSDAYVGARALGTGALAFSVSLLLHFFVPSLPADWLFAGQLPLAMLCWVICGIPPVLLLLAPDDLERAAVHRQAQLIFLEQGLFETKQRTAVLILVSELERRVEILADKGIHRRVGTEGWDKHVDVIIAAIKQGTATEGICDVIQKIGKQVAEEIPASELDNPNELPDEVL